MALRRIIDQDPRLSFQDGILKYISLPEEKISLRSYKIKQSPTLNRFILVLQWFDRNQFLPNIVERIELPALEYLIKRYVFHDLISEHQARNLAIVVKSASKMKHVL